MAQKKDSSVVTMRVRVGDRELEITGPQNFVENKIQEFLKNCKNLASAPPNIATKSTAAAPQPAAQKQLSVAQFFRKFKVSTDVDRVLAAGYYLETFKDNESFIAAEIKEVIRSAKINPPRNTNDSINANIRKGLIMPAGDKDGKRAFVLTTDGEDAIAELSKS